MTDSPFRGLVRRAWNRKPVRVVVWLLCAALVILVILIASIERMPTQVGRIRDASTGAPLPGVTVIRWCYGAPPFSLFDTHGPSSLRGSYVTTTTDDQGRFTLPPFKHRALRAAAWVIFKPGYMPNRFCYAEDGWEPGGCMGTGHSYGGGDPWTDLVFDRSRTRLDVGIRLFTPTIEGVKQGFWDGVTDGYSLRELAPGDVDPWEQYFFRLSELVHEHFVTPPVFIEEATRYVEGRGRVTEEIWRYFNDHLIGWMSIEQCARMQSACERNGAALCGPEISAALFKERLTLEVCARLKADDAQGALAVFERFDGVNQQVREDVITSGWYKAWGQKVPPPSGNELERLELSRCATHEARCTERYTQWLSHPVK